MDILTDVLPASTIAQKRLRVAAALIDFIILWSIGFCLGLLFGERQTFQGESGSGNSIGFTLTGFPALLMMLIWFALLPLMEGVTGQTIGKRLLKLRVVKEDYSSTTIGTSLVRHLFDVIDMIFLVGLVVAATNSKKQRIGDLVAKTLVVNK